MKCEHRKVFIRDNEKFDDIFECEQEECGEFGKAILDDLYAEIDRLSSKLQMIAKILEVEQ